MPADTIWLYCNNCLLHGSLDYFTKHAARNTTAAVWQQSQPTAAQAAYDYIRQLALSLEHKDVEQLFATLGIFNKRVDATTWREKAGRFVGIAESVAFKRFFKKIKNNTAAQEQRGQAIGVFPAWDLPGRICGFIYINSTTDLLRYQHAKPYCERSRYSFGISARIEAGLCMLPAVLESPHQRFGDAVFLFDKPQDAGRLHIRYFSEHRDALPLLATWDDGKRCTLVSLDVLYGRPAYFLPTRYTAALFLQARRVGGQIVRAMPIESRAKLLQKEPLAILTWIQNTAVPWQAALRHAINTLPYQEATTILRTLRLPEWELSDICANAPKIVQMRITASVTPTYRTIRLGRRAVEIQQNTDGWYFVRNKRKTRLTELTFSIDEIIHTTTRKQIFYRGFVHYRKQTIPYLASDTEWRRGPLPWFRDFLISNNLPAAETVNHRGIDLIAVARAFSQPKTIQVPDVVGWDATLAAFVFPQFRITANGQIQKNELPLTTIEPTCPCAKWGDNCAITEAEKAAVATPGGVAILAAMVMQLIAPIFNQQPHKFIVTGAARNRLTSQLLAAGCTLFTTKTTVVHHFPRVVYWPGLFVTPNNTFISAASEDAGFVISNESACGGIWEVDVVSNWPVNVIPAYLADLAKRRFVLPTEKTFTLQVLKDVSAWLGAPVPTNIGLPDTDDWRGKWLLTSLWLRGFLHVKPDTKTAELEYAALQRENKRFGITTPEHSQLSLLFSNSGIAGTQRLLRTRGSSGYVWSFPQEQIVEIVERLTKPLKGQKDAKDEKP
jgi:hypothetical protein